MRLGLRKSLIAGPVLAALYAFLAGGPVQARDVPVDLELVLAVDVSGSVDENEARLQRTGYVEALRHRDVIDAIKSGVLGRIAVTYVEWSGEEMQRTVVDWQLVEDAGSAYAVSKKIDGAPLASGRFTSISAAIRYAVPLFDGNGFDGTRRAIDISGDGANNVGGLVTIARDRAVAMGITINGLPIVNNRENRFGRQLPDLDLYYRNCVIGGRGAFMIVARDFQSFSEAVRRKLVLEIADRMPVPRRLFRRVAAQAAPACDEGEARLRRRLMDHF